MDKDLLLTHCRLYKGERTNPFNKDRDEFNWYIWKEEKNIVDMSSRPNVKKEYNLSTDHSYEEFFKNQIKASLDLWASVPFGGDPEPTYVRYFAIKK